MALSHIPIDKEFRPLLAPKLLEDARACSIVWGRVKGFPAWPAQILSDSAASKRLANVPHKKDQDVPIVFFGTLEIAWLAQSDIVKFKEGLEQGLWNKCKNKSFHKALLQVADFLALDRKRKAPQYWWCRPPPNGHENDDEDVPKPSSKPNTPRPSKQKDDSDSDDERVQGSKPNTAKHKDSQANKPATSKAPQQQQMQQQAKRPDLPPLKRPSSAPPRRPDAAVPARRPELSQQGLAAKQASDAGNKASAGPADKYARDGGAGVTASRSGQTSVKPEQLDSKEPPCKRMKATEADPVPGPGPAGMASVPTGSSASPLARASAPPQAAVPAQLPSPSGRGMGTFPPAGVYDESVALHLPAEIRRLAGIRIIKRPNERTHVVESPRATDQVQCKSTHSCGSVDSLGAELRDANAVVLNTAAMAAEATAAAQDVGPVRGGAVGQGSSAALQAGAEAGSGDDDDAPEGAQAAPRIRDRKAEKERRLARLAAAGQLGDRRYSSRLGNGPVSAPSSARTTPAGTPTGSAPSSVPDLDPRSVPLGPSQRLNSSKRLVDKAAERMRRAQAPAQPGAALLVSDDAVMGMEDDGDASGGSPSGSSTPRSARGNAVHLELRRLQAKLDVTGADLHDGGGQAQDSPSLSGSMDQDPQGAGSKGGVAIKHEGREKRTSDEAASSGQDSLTLEQAADANDGAAGVTAVAASKVSADDDAPAATTSAEPEMHDHDHGHEAGPSWPQQQSSVMPLHPTAAKPILPKPAAMRAVRMQPRDGTAPVNGVVAHKKAVLQAQGAGHDVPAGQVSARCLPPIMPAKAALRAACRVAHSASPDLPDLLDPPVSPSSLGTASRDDEQAAASKDVVAAAPAPLSSARRHNSKQDQAPAPLQSGSISGTASGDAPRVRGSAADEHGLLHQSRCGQEEAGEHDSAAQQRLGRPVAMVAAAAASASATGPLHAMSSQQHLHPQAVQENGSSDPDAVVDEDLDELGEAAEALLAVQAMTAITPHAADAPLTAVEALPPPAAAKAALGGTAAPPMVSAAVAAAAIMGRGSVEYAQVHQQLVSKALLPGHVGTSQAGAEQEIFQCRYLLWPMDEPAIPQGDVCFSLPRAWMYTRPPRYEIIKRNVWVAKNRPRRLNKDEVSICACRPSQQAQAQALNPDGSTAAVVRTACTQNCLNRLSYVHCDPKLCPCGEACSNRPFQQLRQPRTEIFLTEDRGYGVRALEYVPKGTFLVEYAGEVIGNKELWRRMEHARMNDEPHFYIMEQAHGLYIDARRKGNWARLLNSSCDPNCETQKWHSATTREVRVGIFALRDIHPGEELTYDYFFQHYGILKPAAGAFVCKCGAKNCRGTMDVNPEKRRDLGRRVEVYWDGDGVYYRGTVIAFSAASRKHTIMYDDGDKEKVCLEEVPHRWLDDEAVLHHTAALAGGAAGAGVGAAGAVAGTSTMAAGAAGTLASPGKRLADGMPAMPEAMVLPGPSVLHPNRIPNTAAATSDDSSNPGGKRGAGGGGMGSDSEQLHLPPKKRQCMQAGAGAQHAAMLALMHRDMAQSRATSSGGGSGSERDQREQQHLHQQQHSLLHLPPQDSIGALDSLLEAAEAMATLKTSVPGSQASRDMQQLHAAQLLTAQQHLAHLAQQHNAQVVPTAKVASPRHAAIMRTAPPCLPPPSSSRGQRFGAALPMQQQHTTQQQYMAAQQHPQQPAQSSAGHAPRYQGAQPLAKEGQQQQPQHQTMALLDGSRDRAGVNGNGATAQHSPASTHGMREHSDRRRASDDALWQLVGIKKPEGPDVLPLFNHANGKHPKASGSGACGAERAKSGHVSLLKAMEDSELVSQADKMRLAMGTMNAMTSMMAMNAAMGNTSHAHAHAAAAAGMPSRSSAGRATSPPLLASPNTAAAMAALQAHMWPGQAAMHAHMAQRHMAHMVQHAQARQAANALAYGHGGNDGYAAAMGMTPDHAMLLSMYQHMHQHTLPMAAYQHTQG